MVPGSRSICPTNALTVPSELMNEMTNMLKSTGAVSKRDVSTREVRLGITHLRGIMRGSICSYNVMVDVMVDGFFQKLWQ